MGLVEFIDEYGRIIARCIAEFFGRQRTHAGRRWGTWSSGIAATTPFETQPGRNATTT